MHLRVEIFPADLDRTVDFYTHVLAFRLVRDERGGSAPYVALERDAVLVGAARRPAPPDLAARRPPTGVELVLETDDLDREHQRILAAGWPLEQHPMLQPWGLRDLRLLDPDGHYLRLTTSTAPPPDGMSGAGTGSGGT